MNFIELFSLLADENNSRALSSIGTIFQIFGLIIPAFVGIIVFVRRTNRRARDDVLEFLRDWNSPDRNSTRYATVDLFKKLQDKKISLSDIEQDLKIHT